MVIIFPDGVVYSYMGHVCGNKYLTTLHSSYSAKTNHEEKPESINEFKKYLLNYCNNRISIAIDPTIKKSAQQVDAPEPASPAR